MEILVDIPRQGGQQGENGDHCRDDCHPRAGCGGVRRLLGYRHAPVSCFASSLAVKELFCRGHAHCGGIGVEIAALTPVSCKKVVGIAQDGLDRIDLLEAREARVDHRGKLLPAKPLLNYVAFRRKEFLFRVKPTALQIAREIEAEMAPEAALFGNGGSVHVVILQGMEHRATDYFRVHEFGHLASLAAKLRMEHCYRASADYQGVATC